MGDLKDCVLTGYQADLHPKQEFFGMLYGEKYGKRGIIARRWQKRTHGETRTENSRCRWGQNRTQWLENGTSPLFVAVGNRLVHKVNDAVTVDATENHPNAIAKGYLGLQLHQGAPMKVEFKAIKYRKLSGKAAKKALEKARGAKPRKGGIQTISGPKA